MATVGIAVVSTASAVAQQKSEQPPNFIVILADDLGAECLGCYGGTSYQTPELDRLAEHAAAHPAHPCVAQTGAAVWVHRPAFSSCIVASVVRWRVRPSGWAG